MGNPYFDFKQFRVQHDRCAMRVGTDAVILAAWADLGAARRVLDIGTGSGVMALMAAQRLPEAEIVGVDIDVDSVLQARENGAASPFAGRLQFFTSDVRDFTDEKGFDAILCNPPFFTEDTLPPEERRSVARNSCALPFRDLLRSARRLLRVGELHVVLPAQEEPEFTRLALVEGLFLSRLCRVRTTAQKAPKRVLASYSLSKEAGSLFGSAEKEKKTGFEELVLMEDGRRSAAYQQLTKDFYLDSPQPS